MKLSLADHVLFAIERSKGPVATSTLIRMAEVKGYASPRSAVWVSLTFLQRNGYIRQYRPGRKRKGMSGSLPATWVPTVSRNPAPKAGNVVAEKTAKG